MNPSSVTGALHVTDNGVAVSGTVQTFSNAQAIEFTPSASIQSRRRGSGFPDSTALSADSVPLSSFSGLFIVAGSPSNTTATVQAVNPLVNAANVPLNTVIQVEYNQALAAGTINNTNVALYEYATGTYLIPTLSLVGNGQVINIAPTSNLVAGSEYQVYISPNNAVTNSDGLPVQSYAYYFHSGHGSRYRGADDCVAGANQQLHQYRHQYVGVGELQQTIDPVSVTGSTIQLSVGATTEVPSSISFSPDYTRVSGYPLTPLPPSTQMTVTINGVTSAAGISVAETTTNFTTAAQPDFTPPYVANFSVQNGQTKYSQ